MEGKEDWHHNHHHVKWLEKLSTWILKSIFMHYTFATQTPTYACRNSPTLNTSTHTWGCVIPKTLSF
jgi:hypothetical protein